MKTSGAFESYERHAAEVDAEFGRVAGNFAGRIQCRRGCSMCCSQMFSISLLEAAYISRWVKSMPSREAQRLRTAAARYLDEARVMTGDLQAETEETITPRPGFRLPCPALKDDACTIYGARPLICRKWGIPVFNPGKPSELQACELNFKAGEEIEVEGLIAPQVALLEDWVELKREVKEELRHPQMTATVAEAIVKDFEEILFRYTDGSPKAEAKELDGSTID